MMTGAEVVQGLQEIRAFLERDAKLGPEDIKRYGEAIAEALKLPSICLQCEGRGVMFFTHTNHGGGFTVRELRGGGKLYQYPCSACKGKGQRLLERCGGCGEEYRPLARPHPLYIAMLFPNEMCVKCSDKRNGMTGIIPIEPKQAAPVDVKNPPKPPTPSGRNRR